MSNKPEKTLTPVDLMVNGSLAAKAWMFVALGCLACAVTGPYLTALALRQQEHVVILDASGRLIYAPSLQFANAIEYKRHFVRQAIAAIFNRNPNGSDTPELIERLFIEPGRTKVLKAHKSTAQEFLEKQIFQDAKLTQMDVLDSPPIQGHDAIVARCKVQVFRRVLLKGIVSTEPTFYEVRLIMVRNEDLLNNAILPLCVFDFDVTEVSGE